jgi:hypothetical protein
MFFEIAIQGFALESKKSATHKQIGAAEASSLLNGQFRGQGSLTEMDQT